MEHEQGRVPLENSESEVVKVASETCNAVGRGGSGQGNGGTLATGKQIREALAQHHLPPWWISSRAARDPAEVMLGQCFPKLFPVRVFHHCPARCRLDQTGISRFGRNLDYLTFRVLRAAPGLARVFFLGPLCLRIRGGARIPWRSF